MLTHERMSLHTQVRVTNNSTTHFPCCQDGERPANRGFVVQGGVTSATSTGFWAWVPFANRTVFDGTGNNGCPALFKFLQTASGGFIGVNVLLGDYLDANYLDHWYFYAGINGGIAFSMLHDRPRVVRLPVHKDITTCEQAAAWFVRLVGVYRLQTVCFHVVRRTCLVSNLQAWHAMVPSPFGDTPLYAHVDCVLAGSEKDAWLPDTDTLRAAEAIEGQDSTGMDVNVVSDTVRPDSVEEKIKHSQRLLSFLKKRRFVLERSDEAQPDVVAETDSAEHLDPDLQARQALHWTDLPASSAKSLNAVLPRKLLAEVDRSFLAPVLTTPTTTPAIAGSVAAEAVYVPAAAPKNASEDQVFPALLEWLKTRRAAAFRKIDPVCDLRSKFARPIAQTTAKLVQMFLDARVCKNITHKARNSNSARFVTTVRGRRLMKSINCVDDLVDTVRRQSGLRV